jgi:hypothetical protein
MSARILLLVGTIASLTAGAAFAVQAVRKQPEATPPVAATAAPVETIDAVAPVVAENVMPLTARPVRTVSIREPEPAPNPPAANPEQTGETASVLTSAGTAGPEESRLGTTAPTKSTAPAVASLVRQEQSEAQAVEQAAPTDALREKPSHSRKHSSTAARRSRSAKANAEVAAADQSPPVTPTYDGSNESHSLP